VLESDGASTADIDNELAVLRTQSAFVKQMQGDVDGALSDYRNVLKLKLSSANQAVGAVAANNIVSIRGDRDLFDSLKRLKSLEAIAQSDTLTPFQQEAIAANRVLVMCLLNKTDECREALEKLHAQFPHSRILSEITVLLAQKDHKPDDAIAALEKDLSLGGRLGLAHLYLAQGQAAKAAAVIDSIESLAHTPGTVATLMGLYEAAGDAAAAQRVLQAAVAHHKQLDFTSPTAMKIREGECAYRIQKKQYAEAAQAYVELLEGEHAGALDPELRLQSLASLVVALYVFFFCSARATGALRLTLSLCSCPQVVQRRRGCAAALCALAAGRRERRGPRRARAAGAALEPPRVQARGRQRQEERVRTLCKVCDRTDGLTVVCFSFASRKRAAKTPEQVARKRTKRREAHLEKLRSRPDYNASIGLLNPDPERWIPKKQRSYAKRGRRGRNRFVGAQGAGMGTDKDAAKLDAAARAAKKAGDDEKKPTAILVTDSSALLRKSKKKKRR
jgi:hypothetical protein